jgi:hypothetical protein
VPCRLDDRHGVLAFTWPNGEASRRAEISDIAPLRAFGLTGAFATVARIAA